MKRSCTLLFLLLSLNLVVCAQSSFYISGKVLDDSSHLPLAGASVFCQNTTIGTTSNNDGEFSLRLPAGGYELIISFTGYETKRIRLNNNDDNLSKLEVLMKEQEKNLEEVVIRASTEVKDGWEKYGSFFLSQFLGSSTNAEKCMIQNPEVLRFFYSKKKNRLKVLTDSIVQVSNEALGYFIHFKLDSFIYDYNSSYSTSLGYPLFEEMQGDEEQLAVWKKNRESAYLGSRLHFMRSYYDSTLAESGFGMEILEDTADVTGTPIENPYDSLYYNYPDSANVEIDLPDKVRVTYRLAGPEPKYIETFGLPEKMNIQISVLEINGDFIITENGFFYEQADLTASGYWAWQRIADILPYDYWPDE